MAQLVKIAGVQMDIALGRVEENLARITQHFHETAAAGALLTVFPECAISGYCFHDLAEARGYSQPVPGPATEQLAGVCRELSAYLIVGMLERDGERIYNASVLIGPAGVIGKYRKIHLPYLGVDRFTTPGEKASEVFPCGPLRVGMNICYDGSFPESARCLALEGADLIALPTNWPPGGESTADYIINARAIENQVYYLAVNRVGDERGFHFIGKSRLSRPQGGDLAALLDDAPGILYGEIDLEVARNKHLVRVPGAHEIHRFNDRRPELYGRLTQPVDDTSAAIEAERGVLHRQMWAPWRLDYITNPSSPSTPRPEPPRPVQTAAPSSAPPSFIARAAVSDPACDCENLVVYRSPLTITILNRYPYNNGHLLVSPLIQKGRLEELTPAERTECIEVITKMTGVLSRCLNAEGFNIGLNLGRVAGAGVPGHLHWHIVPRWNGDTNFMPAVAGARVIPQSLDALWQILTDAIKQEG